MDLGGLEILSTDLDLQLSSSKKVLITLLQGATHPLAKKKATLNRKIIREFKTLDTPIPWKRFSELEKTCLNYFESIKATPETEQLHKDTIGQLSFQDDLFKSLNQIPFVLFGLAMFKIYMVPAMTLIVPILAAILPYFLLRYMYNLPISITEYTAIIKSMWFGNETGVKGYVQIAFFLFSFIQGIIQPIQNAMHYYATDTVITEVGDAILELRERIESLRTLFEKKSIPFHLSRVLEEFSDKRRSFMMIYEYRSVLSSVFENLGEIEILWKIAHSDVFQEVSFVYSKYPHLKIEGLQDLQIPVEQRIKSSVLLDKKSHHCLVTGPNGGGKSSSLRGILQSILLAQTFGVAAVESMTLTPFSWICSGMRLEDNPGSKSMFQTEVRFAVNLLQPRKGLGLVLYDEIFHSTNPPDCARTARVFFSQLWKRRNIVSFISTHIFELVDEAPTSIQRLCVSGTVKENSADVEFDYKLKEGISKVSSVDTILRKEGLLRSAAE